MGKLEGKIALVTGGSSGIGLAAAKRFVTEGADVFITGRREQELAAAVKEIGRNVTAVRGDVSNLDDLDRVALGKAAVDDRFDRAIAAIKKAATIPGGGENPEEACDR
jgi:NAD(P)-dependent dehydrogenase (short-subunit alcohol dehydrogenase family)